MKVQKSTRYRHAVLAASLLPLSAAAAMPGTEDGVLPPPPPKPKVLIERKVEVRPDPATEQELSAAKKRIRQLEEKLRDQAPPMPPSLRAQPAPPAPTPAQTQLPSSLPVAQEIQGWSKEQVQELQKRAAAALGMAVVGKPCPDCPEEVVIPPGKFQMGRPAGQKGYDDETDSQGRTHKVTLANPLAVTTTEVTQGLWKAVMGAPPPELNFKDCGPDCPVERVNIKDIEAFLAKLNARTGKSYRLLTEAEWEYACRAGGQHQYCGSDDVDKVAWHSGNSDRKTHRAKGKEANAFGLYDMSGNVWEWVSDCWHGNYDSAPTEGHTSWGAENGGDCSRRVVRGGSWLYLPGSSRSALRYLIGAVNRLNSVGFRLARTLKP